MGVARGWRDGKGECVPGAVYSGKTHVPLGQRQAPCLNHEPRTSHAKTTTQGLVTADRSQAVAQTRTLTSSTHVLRTDVDALALAARDASLGLVADHVVTDVPQPQKAQRRVDERVLQTAIAKYNPVRSHVCGTGHGVPSKGTKDIAAMEAEGGGNATQRTRLASLHDGGRRVAAQCFSVSSTV